MRKGMKSNSPRVASGFKVVVRVAGCAARGIEVPARCEFKRWADAVSGQLGSRAAASGEVCVRIVGAGESAGLNRRYRGRSGATNVLTFACDPAHLPPAGLTGDEPRALGDVVIAAPVVEAEAREQGKRVFAHWAHLFVHGMLHLQGFDHVDEEDARDMEAREVRILKRLGFSDPYCPCG